MIFSAYNNIACSINIRVGILTGDDKPKIVFRIVGLESLLEETAKEFKGLVVEQTKDLKLKTFIGSILSKETQAIASQVLPNHFTSVFRKLRDESGAFKGLPEAQRSGFHEIRALGSHLFDQQGVELKSVQAVMAHGDGKMTEYYQSGHGSEIQYVDAPIPALDLAGLGIKI